MAKFDLYKIQLKSLSEDSHSFDYELDNGFFEKIDSPEVQRGEVKALVKLKRISNTFELDFDLKGSVFIPCDRCLDDMEQDIDYQGKLFVKFGADHSQEGDDVIIIPESEGEINLAWLLFEFIALSIPTKHVHEPGKCNEEMASRLEDHLVSSEDDESYFDQESFTKDQDDDIDPRWEELKKIIDNN